MEPLYVNLLGSFTLRRGLDGPVLSEEKSTSRILWTFLQYLLVFHTKDVSQEELMDVLWGECPSANPVSTMKTLLHRSRHFLEELGFPDGKQVLLYRRGIYSWSPEVQMVLDTERFEALCASADQKIEDGVEALQLYQGDFLPKAAGTPWALSLRTYYHGKYLQLCRNVGSFLLEQERYDQVIDICKRAILVDPYDETCHLLLMKALNAIGEQQSALQHYSEMSSLFMDQLGVSPSKESANLYRELLKSTWSIELDLYTIRDKLLEKSPRYGAFYCELGIFQDIYRIEARNAARSGQSVQLIMLTVKSFGGTLEPTHLSTVMQELCTSIQNSLRAGDIFTRFSSTQFLLLAPTANHANGVKIVNRILAAFQNTLSGHTVSVEYSLLPVLPAQEEEQ